MIFHNETMKAAFMGSLGSNRVLWKNTVLKIEIPWIYLRNPTHERFTTRRIMDFSRGIPNI